MAPQRDHRTWPLATEVLRSNVGEATVDDVMPAVFHYHDASRKRFVGNPAEDIAAFLQAELSISILEGMMRHLWFAGAKRPAIPLHFHLSMGRSIVVADRMDLHLLWVNQGKLFVKPMPRFLLDPAFCRRNLQCADGCACQTSPTPACRINERRVALGFLYTYACLISSETDFHIANENRLLPRNRDDTLIKWEDWKTLARELLGMYQRDPTLVHQRFVRAELRLSRLNTIHRFTRLPLLEPYLRDRHNYGSLFRDNLAWMAASTVFIALVLTAMQVGLATERLQGNAAFQRASYGFTVFAILGPVCAFGLVVLRALLILAKDLSLIFGGKPTRARSSARPDAPV